jgi:hypothetical protein
MSRSYMSSNDLIASVKRRIMAPQSQSTFEDADFLAFADEEMDIGLVPSIISAQEDYLMYTQPVYIQPNQIKFPIPYRAIGNKLREVSFMDQSGNYYQMTRIGVGDLPFYNQTTNNRAYAFYIENNEVVLVPNKISTGTDTYLMMTYYIRPSSLVLLDEVAVVNSIDRTTGVIQLSNIPDAFTTTELFDFVKVKSPNKILTFDNKVVSINTTSKTMTFNPTLIPSGLDIGDHITLAEECAVPQVPSDLHVVLAHRTAARVLEALGDTEGLATANQKLGEMEAKTQELIYNRVEDAPKKVVNRNGVLRSGRYGWAWGRSR